jgi:hypothetical protein
MPPSEPLRRRNEETRAIVEQLFSQMQEDFACLAHIIPWFNKAMAMEFAFNRQLDG